MRFWNLVDIQLIQPAKSPGYTDNSRTGCYAPIGLVSIATYTQKIFPNANIELFDGELITNEEIINRLKPNSIVGIETKMVNYASAIEIAKAAKNIGSKVIIGGVYASAIPETIMRHRSDVIDHIVSGYGEKPFIDIINGKEDKIIDNQQPSFDELPIPDRNSFVNLEAYITNFQKEHPTWNPRGTNIFTHMGCKYRCIMCSRQGPKEGISFRSPEKVWEEIRDLVEDYNIEYLVDFSDAITQNIGWLKQFVDSKPTDISPIFHVFSTANDINEVSLELLNRLNTQHIFMGIETGDPDTAKVIGKGRNFSPGMSLDAIELITNNSITITPSFVLGFPNESEKSLENTYQLAKQIHEITNFEEIFCSALIPFPGSIAFDKLRNRHNLDTDMLDPDELKKLWIDSFCNVDYETIMSYSDKILALGKYKITIKKHTSNPAP